MKSKVTFKFLSGDVDWRAYGGRWISPQLNNGDWDYWLVMELTNFEDAFGKSKGPRYGVSIHAVSPTAAGADNLKKAYECLGMTQRASAEGVYDETDEVKVEALDSYGVYAMLWNKAGNNARELMKEARKEAQVIQFMFGFYMDKQANMIGHTGWDFIRGDLSLNTAEKNLATA